MNNTLVNLIHIKALRVAQSKFARFDSMITGADKKPNGK
jgi:hypothetical protein